MFIRLLGHARANVVAYLALLLAGLALAGGAYAALAVPDNSVGARQIRNHSIGPVKFDPRAIGGSVRHWARVDATGRIVASGSRARDLTPASSQGVYLITWSDSFSNRCAAIATVLGPVAGLGASSGYANARVTGVHPTGVFVSTYGPDGKQAPAPFSVVVVC
jgi:hypothetical protein